MMRRSEPPALRRRIPGWLRVAAPAVLLLLGVYVFVPRSGDLSGDVIVTLTSGDIERTAGIEVVLVRATDFEAARAEATPGRDAATEAKQAGAAARRVLGILRSPAIVSPAAQTTTTDGTGRYQFSRAPRGRFYVVATHTIVDRELTWAVPIEIGGVTQRLDLSNRNESWPIPTHIRK